MNQKLNLLYNECIEELNKIGINTNNEIIGKIDINLAKRNAKRYGCCKQEEPLKKYFHYETVKGRKHKVYDVFNIHHIEISKWVMDLDNKIIKNTIMHEIIHCFPNCNNHGAEFKKYAKYINEKLGYNISRLGNKKEDYEKSNVEYKDEDNMYKYKIICKECNQIYYRKRLTKNFTLKYRCGKCRGKLVLA